MFRILELLGYTDRKECEHSCGWKKTPKANWIFLGNLKTSGPNNSQVKPGQNQNINQELHPPDAKLMMYVLLPVHTLHFEYSCNKQCVGIIGRCTSYKLLSLWISVSINDTGLVTDLLEWIWQLEQLLVCMSETQRSSYHDLPPRKLWIFSWRQDIRQRALTQMAADVCLSRGDNFQWSRGCN